MLRVLRFQAELAGLTQSANRARLRPLPHEDGFGDRDSIDDDRADGAEHDWLYQRRHGYDEIYDPWAPEEVEERRRDSLNWFDKAPPFNPPAPHQPDGPEDRDFAAEHEKT